MYLYNNINPISSNGVEQKHKRVGIVGVHKGRIIFAVTRVRFIGFIIISALMTTHVWTNLTYNNISFDTHMRDQTTRQEIVTKVAYCELNNYRNFLLHIISVALADWRRNSHGFNSLNELFFYFIWSVIYVRIFI